MARGRFISKEITLDKKVNSLSSAYSMLAFTWLLTHTDGYGRVYGDPAVVKSIIFPRRQDVTVDDVEGYIREWSDTGLVVWYEVAGDKYIEFPNFSKHQVGLNMTKEAKSNIPPNPTNSGNPQEIPEIPGGIPENSGKLPENSGGLLPEVNRMSIAIEGEEEVVVEGNNGGSGSLLATFTELYPGMQPRANTDQWADALSRMTKAGVTPSIMRRAARELAEKKMKVASPGSLVNPCLMVMQKDPPRKSNKDGAFRDAVIT